MSQLAAFRQAKALCTVSRPLHLPRAADWGQSALRFLKLPPGSIAPEGWLRQQLLLDANGLPGRMQQISEYLKTNNNGWVQPGGTCGWEEVPYWLRGYEELDYALKDQPQKHR